MMTAQQITEFLGEDEEYNHYGIRIHPSALVVGDTVPASYVWVDGDQTDEQLPGCCVVGLFAHRRENVVKALAKAKKYTGKAYLVASRRAAGMDVERNDEGEDILLEAVVVSEVAL